MLQLSDKLNRFYNKIDTVDSVLEQNQRRIFLLEAEKIYAVTPVEFSDGTYRIDLWNNETGQGFAIIILESGHVVLEGQLDSLSIDMVFALLSFMRDV